MIAAVAIDDWKLAIFSRHLRDAGYKYDVADDQLTKDTILLTVPYEPFELAKLHAVITSANNDCAKRKDRK